MKNRSNNDKYALSRKQAAKDAEKRLEREKLAKYSNAVVSDAFLKVKRKFIAEAIIKSVVCGISCGLFAVGLLLLIIKLNGIPFGIVWYIVAGVACALLCGGITYLFLKPSNKRVAKTVDEEFGLKEQVQTSLAFSRSSGEVVTMQRVCAESAINALPHRKFKFSKIWQYIVIAVVALALAVAGILVPGKEVKGSTGNDEPGVVLDRSHIAKVEQIIEYIRNENEERKKEETSKANGQGGSPERYISETLADSLIAELEDFRAMLEEYLEKDIEVVPGQVWPVLFKITTIITAETNYIQIAEIIIEHESETAIGGSLGELVRAGGDAYRTAGFFLTTAEIDAYHREMEKNASDAIDRKSTDLFNWLLPADPAEENKPEQGPDISDNKTDEEKRAEAIERIEQIKTMFEETSPKLEALENLMVAVNISLNDENLHLPNKELTACFDELYKSFGALKTSTEEAYNSAPDISSELSGNAAQELQQEYEETFENWGNEISEEFDKFFTLLCRGNSNISETLGKQSYYMALDRFISNVIRNAFHLELIQPDKIENEGNQNGNPNDDETDDGNNQTGGSGKDKFPGDEYVWNWERQSENDGVVFYGDGFDTFLNRMTEFLENGGELTEKQKQMIQAYFDSLQSKTGDK